MPKNNRVPREPNHNGEEIAGVWKSIEVEIPLGLYRRLERIANVAGMASVEHAASLAIAAGLREMDSEDE